MFSLPSFAPRLTGPTHPGARIIPWTRPGSFPTICPRHGLKAYTAGQWGCACKFIFQVAVLHLLTTSLTASCGPGPMHLGSRTRWAPPKSRFPQHFSDAVQHSQTHSHLVFEHCGRSAEQHIIDPQHHEGVGTCTGHGRPSTCTPPRFRLGSMPRPLYTPQLTEGSSRRRLVTTSNVPVGS